jgi:pimeloyl-ACP methyl ester carboxylesterase
MGNTWKGISDDLLVSAELALLKRGGLDMSRVFIEDVMLDWTEEDGTLSQNYIHHVEIRPEGSESIQQM